MQIIRQWALAMAIGLSSGASAEPAADAEQTLTGAWADFLVSLKAAERALLDDQWAAPPASSRVLAEGYRYLLGHLNREIEYQLRADPRFPEFFRSMDMLRKWTGENPDTMYLKAPIDSEGFYRVQITAVDGDSSGHLADLPAPRAITFQTITSVPGYSGELSEMSTCKNQTLAHLNRFDFESLPLPIKILLGPERPADYEGLFLPTRRSMTCAATGKTAEAQATMLSVREIFSDWSNEYPLDLTIERLDTTGMRREPYTPDAMAEHIRTIGEHVTRQIRFWNQVMAGPMEMQADVNGDGERTMPVNGINPPALPFTAGGVAGAQQLYASGIFDLAEDEALIVRMTAPVEPAYVGFQLNNLWMEGPDQQNAVSSLSGHQNPVASDGSRYYIIAHRDPGVRGWVDTTGIDYGFHSFRFIFPEVPGEENMPVASAWKVPFEELTTHLPKDIERVSPDQRRAEVAERQQHIKRRWRNY
jgi:hypothetical protein